MKTTTPIAVAFCADRKVLPGLHAAVYSALLNCTHPQGLHFHVLSEDFDHVDMDSLRRTAEYVGKPFFIDRVAVSSREFGTLKPMRGSLACYYRFLIPSLIKYGRILYLDSDVVCNVDLVQLAEMELNGMTVGMVPEWPLSAANADGVIEALGGKTEGDYYNSGVIVIDREKWLDQKITERCFQFLSQYKPKVLHDQPAVNYALYGKIFPLPLKYNCTTQKRSNWPLLRGERPEVIIHYISIPKPWDWLGWLLHPYYRSWNVHFRNTDLAVQRGLRKTNWNQMPRGAAQWKKYRRMAKDRLVFEAYRLGLLKKPKGL